MIKESIEKQFQVYFSEFRKKWFTNNLNNEIKKYNSIQNICQDNTH